MKVLFYMMVGFEFGCLLILLLVLELARLCLRLAGYCLPDKVSTWGNRLIRLSGRILDAQRSIVACLDILAKE